jgi:two-component system cell cycle response regulator CtrA
MGKNGGRCGYRRARIDFQLEPTQGGQQLREGSDDRELLREEVDTLREQVRQLKQMLGITARFVYPPQVKLSPATSKVFGLLMQREVVSKDTMMQALYFDRPDDIPGDRIIHMFIFRLRGELAGLDVEIKKSGARGTISQPKTRNGSRQ